MVTKAEGRLKEWQLQNPLRLRRGSRSRASVAAQIGVSATAVEKWEQGLSTPNPANMAAVARVVSVGYKSLRAEWSVWESSRPR